jgi:hypothetical protein
MESRGKEHTREDHADRFGIGINCHRSILAGLK